MTEEATPPNPAEVAASEYAGLAADTDFAADFSGRNGREAQKAAVDRKSALARTAFGDGQEATPRDIPELLQDALKAPDALTRQEAEHMIPAASASEYRFNFATDGMDFKDVSELNNMAAQTAFAIGASPEYARATFEQIDRKLSRGGYEPTTPAATDAVLVRQFGDKAEAVGEAALAAFQRLPERERHFVSSTLSRLDAETSAWAIGRLARVSRMTSKKDK